MCGNHMASCVELSGNVRLQRLRLKEGVVDDDDVARAAMPSWATTCAASDRETGCAGDKT